MQEITELIEKEGLKKARTTLEEERERIQKKPAYNHKTWSDEEIKFITAGSKKFTVEELAEKLGRTRTAVYQKLMKIERESKDSNVKKEADSNITIPVMGRVSAIDILGKKYVSIKGELYLLSNEG